jgi:hypothetical protein
METTTTDYAFLHTQAEIEELAKKIWRNGRLSGLTYAQAYIKACRLLGS